MADEPEEDVCIAPNSATASNSDTNVDSSKETPSDDTIKKTDNDNPSNIQHQSSQTMNQVDEETTSNAQQPPLSLETGKICFT